MITEPRAETGTHSETESKGSMEKRGVKSLEDKPSKRKVAFEQVLADPHQNKAFFEHLKSETGGENWYFLMDMKTHPGLLSGETVLTMDEVTRFYETYIEPGEGDPWDPSEEEKLKNRKAINVSHSTHKQLTEIYSKIGWGKGQHPTAHLKEFQDVLKKAYAEIEKLTINDPFVRFQSKKN